MQVLTILFHVCIIHKALVDCVPAMNTCAYACSNNTTSIVVQIDFFCIYIYLYMKLAMDSI